MANINQESCGLWVQQRMEEELASGEKSMREIGRIISREIEKIFEVEIKPETIRKKAGRVSGTFVPPVEKSVNTRESVGTVGTITEQIEIKKTEGKSINQASKEVAKDTGKNPETIRKTYNREVKKQEKIKADYSRSDLAIRYAKMAIEDLRSIGKSDPKRAEAFELIINWINQNR